MRDPGLVVWNASSPHCHLMQKGDNSLPNRQVSPHKSPLQYPSLTITAWWWRHTKGNERGRKARTRARKMKYILNVLWKNNLTQSNIHLLWIQYSFWNDIRRYLLYLPLCSHLPFSGSKLCALVRKWANACLYLAGYMPWIYSLLQEVIGNYSGHLGNHCLPEIHVILKNN